MAALTKDRNTPEGLGDVRNPGVAAATIIHAGSLVMLDGGYAKPAATAVGKVALGRAEKRVDNSAGADGDLRATVKRGIFRWANSAAADEIAAADIGGTAYIVDDQTVAKTDGGATRSAAGKIHDVDAKGVWVETL